MVGVPAVVDGIVVVTALVVLVGVACIIFGFFLHPSRNWTERINYAYLHFDCIELTRTQPQKKNWNNSHFH